MDIWEKKQKQYYVSQSGKKHCDQILTETFFIDTHI